MNLQPAALLMSFLVIFQQLILGSIFPTRPATNQPNSTEPPIQLLGKVSIQPEAGGIRAQSMASIYTVDLAADAKYAYIENMYGIFVIDFFDAEGPKVIGSLSGPNSGFMDWVNPHYLYTYGSWINIFDAGNPAKISIAGSLETGFQTIRDVAYSGNYAYSTWSNPGSPIAYFRVIDITDPVHPRVVGSSELTMDSYYAIAVDGHHAYLATDRGLTVIDVQNKVNPQVVYQNSGLWGYYEPIDVAKHGNLLLVQGNGWNNGATSYVRAFDVTDPANPKEYPNPFSLHRTDQSKGYEVRLMGRTVFLTAGPMGFYVLDYTNPSQPVVIDQDSGINAQHMALAGNLLYVADGDSNLWCYQLNLKSITGRVLNEFGQPVAGIQISNGSYLEPTDDTGAYQFDGLFSGNYVLTPTNTGYIFSPTQRSAPVPPSLTGQDFTAILPSISGMVRTINGQPYTGATVSISNGLSPSSGLDGRYHAEGIAPGSYTLTPTIIGYRFSPETATATIPPYHIQQDFTILPLQVVQTVTPDQPATFTFTDVQGTITTINIPAGAVEEPIEIHLVPTKLGPRQNLILAGHAFDLVAYRQGNPIAQFQFKLPVLVSTEFSKNDTAWIEDIQQMAWYRLETEQLSLGRDTCNPPSESIDGTNLISQVSLCTSGTYGLFGTPKRIYLPVIVR